MPSFSLNMDMNWLMFLAVKEERESEKSENFRHILKQLDK